MTKQSKSRRFEMRDAANNMHAITVHSVQKCSKWGVSNGDSL